MSTFAERVIESYEHQQERIAELKELVLDLYNCDDEPHCSECRHYKPGDGFYCDLGAGWKTRRMRELGIEVDE